MNKSARRAIRNSIKTLGIAVGAVVPYSSRQVYRRHWREFRAKGGVITQLRPIFSDWSAQAGVAKGHYFHQDLLVASYIHEHAPERHIDIGSRIDGFVAHVAAFRQIEVLDVRELASTSHPNIRFLRADLMDETQVSEGMADSVSCLHAIEHFGLGRYGDPIDPDGHLVGFRNMARMLKPGGMLYVSFPIGAANEVHFNAHRIFHAHDIFAWPGVTDRLRLESFDYVDDRGALHRNVDVLRNCPETRFGCGIYTFRKN